MTRQMLLVFLVAVAAASCAAVPARPPYAKPVAWPTPAPSNCTPLPEGLRLYGGVSVAEIERAGRFPMQEPEQRYIDTSSPLWVRFRAGLEPTDTVFEYALDESWERGVMHHGGLSAFRNNCTIQREQAWTT